MCKTQKSSIRSIDEVEEEQEISEAHENRGGYAFSLNTLQGEKELIQVEVGGVELKVLPDSGADINVVDEKYMGNIEGKEDNL